MALRAQNNISPLYDSVNNFNVTLWRFTGLFAQGEFQPHNNWDKWLDHFQVTYLAKSSTITELTREMTQQTPGAQTIVGGYEDTAKKKVVNVMYLSMGEAARNHFKEKKPHTIFWNLRAGELTRLTTESSQLTVNRELDRHRVFSKLDQPGNPCTISGTQLMN